MSAILHHRRKAFRGGGGGIGTPLHWWDLDNVTASDGIADQGTGAWGDLTTTGTITANSTGGPNGQPCLQLDNDEWLDRTDVAWDGGTDHISMACWAYMDAFNSIGNWVLSWQSGGGNPSVGQLFFRNTTTDSIRGTVYDDDTDALTVESTTVPATGVWYHMCFTWDGTTNRVYINGSEENTGTDASIGALEVSASNFAIGTASWTKGLDTFNHEGRVMSCGIWDFALSADDVSTLYNSGDGGYYSDFTWS